MGIVALPLIVVLPLALLVSVGTAVPTGTTSVEEAEAEPEAVVRTVPLLAEPVLTEAEPETVALALLSSPTGVGSGTISESVDIEAVAGDEALAEAEAGKVALLAEPVTDIEPEAVAVSISVGTGVPIGRTSVVEAVAEPEAE